MSTLRNDVDRVLEAPSFVQTLRAQNIEIARSTSPKQTETTQRWTLTHYPAAVAFVQKVLALALRAQVQSRDIFDLKLLLDAGAGKDALPRKALGELPKAIENAMEVDYDDFAGQVLAYLEPEYQAHYKDRKTWAALQEQVVDAKIATREKALFDTLYLAPDRSRMFAVLPELTIPRGFKWAQVNEYVDSVKSQRRRAFLEKRIRDLRERR